MNRDTKVAMLKDEYSKLKPYRADDPSSYPSNEDQRARLFNISNLEKNYRVYEKFIKNIIYIKKCKFKKLRIKKGEIIIWAANLLHGGTKMINKKLTRKSQVVHFHFDKGELFYNPGFSDPKKGVYVERKLDIVRR